MGDGVGCVSGDGWQIFAGDFLYGYGCGSVNAHVCRESSWGFLSTAMLFLLAGTVVGYTISSGAPVAVASVALLAGWTISAYVIRRKAATISVVLCRGFLLRGGGLAGGDSGDPGIARGLSEPA